MGYMRHHALLVTSWDAGKIESAHAKALSLFEDHQISAVSPAAINGYTSFAVFPDGSKEGWEESDAGDYAREAFRSYLRAFTYPDGSSSVDWVEVQYGDDNGVTRVCHHSDDPTPASSGGGAV